MANRLIELVRSKHFTCCRDVGRCGKCLSSFVNDILNPIELANGSEPIKSGDYGLFGPYTFGKNFTSVGRSSEYLLNELLTLPIKELIKLKAWPEIIRMVFHVLPPTKPHNLILRKWLLEVEDNVRVTDVLLFYVVRKTQIDPDIYEAWVQKAIGLAVQSRDVSLVESLILTVNDSISKYRWLLDLATELSQESLATKMALTKMAGCNAL